MIKPLFRGQAFVSALMVVGFIVLSLSGMVLYLAPHGRGAGGAMFLSLSRHDWGDVHIVFGFLFMAAGLVHIFFNGRTLLTYVRRKRIDPETRQVRFQWGIELLAAALLGFVLIEASLLF